MSKHAGQPMAWGQRGYVYFIEAGDFVKIGWCRHKPTGRMAIMQTGCPHKMRVLTYRVGTLATERKVHQKLAAHRVRGEWFSLCDEVRRYIGPSAKRTTRSPNSSPNTEVYAPSNWLI